MISNLLSKRWNIIGLIAVSLFLANKYALIFQNISNDRFVPIEHSVDSGATVHFYKEMDINNDNIIDTFIVTEHYFSGWLENTEILGLINIREGIGIGLIRSNAIKDYTTNTMLIDKSQKKFSILVVESAGSDFSHIFDYKVIGFDQGIFFQRTPTLLEYLEYKLSKFLPSAQIG